MFTESNGDRSDVRDYIILLTDGASNIREDETMPLAIDVRANGVKIISVSIGQDINMLEMRGMY